MPLIRINQTEIYYEDKGEARLGTLVFSHSLLCNLRMFDAQVEALQKDYRCLSFDFRGQGQSSVSATGYDMDTLAQDAKTLIEEKKAGPCHFIGLSMGGFVGLRLAIHYPELLQSLVLMNTSHGPEDPQKVGKYRTLNLVARNFGFKIVTSRVLPIMFGQTFLKDPAKKELKQKWKEILWTGHRIGVTRAVKGVTFREGLSDESLQSIQVPTLIIAGEEDVATPPAKSELMRNLIPGVRYELLPKVGHLSTIESPEQVNPVIQDFLKEVETSKTA